MKALAKTPYMRNMWKILDRFKYLPTSPEFQELNDFQLDLMMYSFDQDNYEEEMRQKLRSGGEVFEDDEAEDIANMSEEEWENYVQRDREKIQEQQKNMELTQELEDVEGTNETNLEDFVQRENEGEAQTNSQLDEFQEGQLERMQRLAAEFEERTKNGENITFDDVFNEDQEKQRKAADEDPNGFSSVN